MSEALMVAGRARVEVLLDALARRIHARLEDGVEMVGTLRRGAPLAERLATTSAGSAAPRGWPARSSSSATPTTCRSSTRSRREDRSLPFKPEGTRLLLVDDVLYSGRTLLAATRHLLEAGAEQVDAAVLCARGETEVPVAAELVGLSLDIGADFLVDVHVPPYGERLGIEIRRRTAAEGS